MVEPYPEFLKPARPTATGQRQRTAVVVDPGIHMLGWAREQAVEFAVASGRFDREVADSLVDRVAFWPGQLTAHDTGALEFFALRDLAQDAGRALGYWRVPRHSARKRLGDITDAARAGNALAPEETEVSWLKSLYTPVISKSSAATIALR